MQQRITRDLRDLTELVSCSRYSLLQVGVGLLTIVHTSTLTDGCSVLIQLLKDIAIVQALHWTTVWWLSFYPIFTMEINVMVQEK